MEAIIDQLEKLARKAFQSGNKFDFIDPAYELCGQLEELESPATALEPLFRLIERCPEIDFGGPGPLGAFLESFYDSVYEPQLLASLDRKPTVYTVYLLDRVARDDNNPRQAELLQRLVKLAEDAALPARVHHETMACIRAAAEELHPWDANIAAGITAAKQVIAEEDRLQEERQRNESPAPGGTVLYQGITCKLINRSSAEILMPVIRDLPGYEKPYDVWAENVPGNAFYLVVEGDARAEDFSITSDIPGMENLTVLGWIFIRGLIIRDRLISSSNVPLIVFGDVACPQIRLQGGRHYFGGNVTAGLIWAGGSTICFDGSVTAKVVLADATPVFIRERTPTTRLISMMGMNFYSMDAAVGEWLQTPGTAELREVFLPELIAQDEDGDDILAEAPAMERILQNKSLLK
ncbi:hypothetical protein [Chitinophaga rhizosphaerae]|uniref:hypothetical protein n=1 Tax=Chitinophaga rhizosphaerae TaxID=1864947 RepID=UPI000F815517|nr:hypothetical protein [Chitinophaga rhizosphaerae]